MLTNRYNGGVKIENIQCIHVSIHEMHNYNIPYKPPNWRRIWDTFKSETRTLLNFPLNINSIERDIPTEEGVMLVSGIKEMHNLRTNTKTKHTRRGVMHSCL